MASGILTWLAEHLRPREGRQQGRAVWLESIPWPLLMADRAGRLRYANPAASVLFGAGPEELAGSDISSLITLPEDKTVFASASLGLRPARRRDGTAMILSVDIAPSPADGLLMVLPRLPTDEDRSISPKHFLAEQLLQSVAEDEGVGSWLLNLETGALIWSPEVYRMFGRDRASFVPTIENYFECVHPDERDSLRQSIEAGMKGEGPFDLEVRIVRPDGEVRKQFERNHVHRRPDGTIDYLWGTVMDITRLKTLQEELRFARLAVEHCSEGVAIARADLSWSFVNPALCRLAGRSAEALLGDGAIFLHPETRVPLDAAAIASLLGRQRFWQGEMAVWKADGTLVPVLVSISSTRGEMDEDGGYVWVAADITRIKDYERRLREMALYDPLTGLANRSLLNDRLGVALRQVERENDRLAVVFLDLDGFKPVNDRLGHEAGDAVLRDVADRLLHAVREGDTVARWGGDEFIIVLPRCGDAMSIAALVGRVEAAMCFDWAVADEECLPLSASVGVAIYPDDARDSAMLLRRADAKMYAAKSARAVASGRAAALTGANQAPDRV